ncbi:MAG: ornithine carbamoyltransferase [Candidatus Syntropharchaeia archaeon]
MNLISIADFSFEDIKSVIEKSIEFKSGHREFLKNKSLAMIFEKPSTRTRVSFEVAMTQLGGHALYLNWRDLQLGRGESITDTARVLSSYVDGIMIRAYKHDTITEFAKSSRVPVINGLSDVEHPCQSLADLLTIREFKGDFSNLKFAWIGDGNNVCHSSILACAITGMKISVACPKGYEPKKEILSKAEEIEGDFEVINDPFEAAENADILYTDVWVSMGDEKQKEKRMKDFKGFQINEELLKIAKKDAIMMHCLPAHIGEEITEGIMYGKNSVIFEQAENRLHSQKGLLFRLLR